MIQVTNKVHLIELVYLQLRINKSVYLESENICKIASSIKRLEESNVHKR